MPDAPYSGGYVPGGRVFAVSGDFTIAAPCGPPEITFPLSGDSSPSAFPIIILDRTLNSPNYVSVPVGQGFNSQDFNNEQSTMAVEQEFMVAEQSYSPLPLNTLYNVEWSVGWGLGANALQAIGNCFLVEEGPLVGVGAGIVRFKRKFVNLPPNRNEYESYAAQFPGLDYGIKDANNLEISRVAFARIVNSRMFHEYFVYDNAGLLPGIALFPGGHRLTSELLGELVPGTNIPYGAYLLIEDTKWFNNARGVADNVLLGADPQLTDDAAGPGIPNPTVPSFTDYNGWMNTAEIVAEASSFTRWMGNIFVRRTRFVLAI